MFCCKLFKFLKNNYLDYFIFLQVIPTIRYPTKTEYPQYVVVPVKKLYICLIWSVYNTIRHYTIISINPRRCINFHLYS